MARGDHERVLPSKPAPNKATAAQREAGAESWQKNPPRTGPPRPNLALRLVASTFMKAHLAIRWKVPANDVPPNCITPSILTDRLDRIFERDGAGGGRT